MRRPETDEAPLAAVRAMSRRRFLAGGLGGLLMLGGFDDLSRATGVTQAASLPEPARSGIEHVVLVTMENRSFDHLLGWLPGANGRQAGLTYHDRAGVAHATYPLAPNYQGCGHPDPNHRYKGGRIEFNHGRCDGWLRAGRNDTFSIGYYRRDDLPFLGAAAAHWTVLDHYYPAIMAGTFPNRIYQHAGQTDRLTDSLRLSALPTIWDRLQAAGLEGRYYYSDVPFLGLWGLRHLDISRSMSQFVADCAAGTLPHVAYVDPEFSDEEQGLSNDDHPHADIRNGEAFLNRIYRAVTTGPRWGSTVLIITFDEWGGFFDHAPPKRAPIPPATRAAGDRDGRRGFRVPTLLISPWSRRGYVAHAHFDHTSVLRLIEWRWGLAPLTVRDATARNLAKALDFSHHNLTAPQFAVPAGPFGGACGG